MNGTLINELVKYYLVHGIYLFLKNGMYLLWVVNNLKSLELIDTSWALLLAEKSLALSLQDGIK